MVDRFPDHEALVSLPQQRRLTYSQLRDSIDRVARGLVNLGFNRGDRVGIWSTNNIEWLQVQMATARIGVILVNINPAYRPRELEFALQQSQLQGLFVIPRFRSSDYIGMLLELIPEMRDSGPEIRASAFPCLRRVILYDPADSEETELPAPGFTRWQELVSAGEKVSRDELQNLSRQLDRDDVINIQYTSGTTGFPKAVMLSHHNILNNAWFAAQAMHFGARDRLAVAVPFYHCFGMVLANLMFIEMLEREDFASFDLSSLRTGIMAGAPCPPELMTRVIEDMHCADILIGYGETEASPLTHLTTADDSFERRIESVGHNLPHQEVKIIDTDSRTTVAIGQVGEICFRGYHVMRGYYGEADKTAQAIDAAGWLYSGDLGTMDQQGYVRITGRRKEMIIRGGENIYPREIEDYLFTHPKVAEAAVFGVPDKRMGEQVAAWIQLHAGENMTASEIRDFCKDKIAYFKIPEYIQFVDEFPLTVTGKLQKFKMREAMVERLQQAGRQQG
jgi:fatty-acyl-CoA synthase